MLQTVCYGFLYLFEVFACLMFHENFYLRKVNRPVLLLFNVFAFAIQFLGMIFMNIPIINLITFLISNFLIAFFCYDSKLKTCIFTSLMLSFFMLITELIIIYSTTELLKINSLYNWEENAFALIIMSSSSKLLFFVVIIIVSKLFKNKNYSVKDTKTVILLSLLPLTSIGVFLIMTFWGLKMVVSASSGVALTACSMLLLFANILVFYVYDLVQKTNEENLQLQLEKQYTDISAKFYEDLSREYDNSRILIHDIKRHLNYIADKTAEGELQEVLKYIGDVTGDFGLNNRIKYSGYPIVDAMINRYVHFCKRDGIKLEIEPLMTGLTFMIDTDVIALLGNLFDNAVEATLKTNEPRIMIGIHHAGEKITVIRVSNTCKSAPKAILGKLITSKLLNKDKHGIGTKSIMRVVEKYDGDFRWEYDKETKIFTASIFVQDTGVKK